MNKDNKLTTESHWDKNWVDFSPSVISSGDTILGKKRSLS